MAALFAASGASAQSPTTDPGHVRRDADARFNEGLKAYDKGDFEGARTAFLQAQAIDPRPSQMWNLALTELRTNHPLDAMRHLKAFIADPGTAVDARGAAERKLGVAYAQTGHLSVTAPAGSRVQLDGKDVGIAPLREAVDVETGPHRVDAVVGTGTMHETVNALAGKLTEIVFAAPAVASTQIVAVPPVITPVPVGRVGEVEVPERREPYWNSRRTVGIVIAGVGAVGMAVGGVFGAERGSETTDANNALKTIGTNGSACFDPTSASLKSACTALANAHSSNGSDAHAEDALLIGGGVLVVVGLVTAFWPSSPEPRAAGFIPMAGPHVAGLQWGGSF